MKETIKYIKKNNIENPIIYILACRIVPFINHYKRILNKIGATLIVTPEGHEWKRAKSNAMIKTADLIICNSVNIENYIHEQYNAYNTK